MIQKLYISYDYGVSWQYKNVIYDLSADIVVDSKGIIYCDSHYGGEVYRSTDRGDSWSIIPNTINATGVYTLAIDYYDTLYAIFSMGPPYHDASIFKLTDNSTWQSLFHNLGFLIVDEYTPITVDKNGRVYSIGDAIGDLYINDSSSSNQKSNVTSTSDGGGSGGGCFVSHLSQIPGCHW